MKELIEIQSQLKAPKSQENKFGGYKYRSCEDILEAVKPLLKEQGCTLTISDEMVEVGGRIYVKATAVLSNGTEQASTTAFAREAETRKGMDDSQITGSASSYARKYALNGLFCIDDTKDADATNDHGETKPKGRATSAVTAEARIKKAATLQALKAVWDSLSHDERVALVSVKDARRDELEKAA